MQTQTIISWIFRIVAALILLSTLFFKFTGAEESVALFTKLGVEPWGRYLTGVLELITAVLLIIPRTAPVGAAMGLGVMGGAIMSHLLVLGIESAGDGGQLFIEAILVALACAVVLFIHRKQLLSYIPFLSKNQ